MSYTIRRATALDAAVIAHHRVAMFSDMGLVPTEALAARLRETSAAALEACLCNGTYLGWLAVAADGKILGGAGVHVKPQLPRISQDGRSVDTADAPLVVNVYTEPSFRRQGLARQLMVAIMTWATEAGFDRVDLHASDAGRPLYRSLGFASTNEMRWSPER